MAIQEQKPTIFIENFSDGLNLDSYIEQLRAYLIENGFSSELKVIRYSWWKSIWTDKKAYVQIRSSYYRGAVLDAGVLGFAIHGSNAAVVYGKGQILGRYNDPSIVDLVNVTAHELGHAIFSFDHSANGVMYKAYRNGSPLIPFTDSQKTIISNSRWGN